MPDPKQKYSDAYFGFKDTDSLEEKREKFEKRILIDGFDRQVRKSRLRGVILYSSLFIFTGLLIWGGSSFFKSDSYTGFFYPDADNLTNDIQSQREFKSLEGCRTWVKDQAAIYNPGGGGYDYECGKNCKLSGGKPYICEETLE